MARISRASLLLLTALGVASIAPSATAAANGGAAPGTISVSSTGGAAPGVTPVGTTASSHPGGAAPGRKPHRRVVRHRVRRPRHHVPAPGGTPPTPPPTSGPQTPAPSPTPVDVPTVAGVFPLLGSYSFGGDDARFGAGRTGHIHQGQDVIAVSGTPIVAPVAGTIVWKANQEGGAGIYLVLHAPDGRDYVFMHIKSGTVAVAVGDAVAQGQQLAQVGATGDADGPHLHFEIWPNGWYAKGSAPIDPLPQLQRWAGLAG